MGKICLHFSQPKIKFELLLKLSASVVLMFFTVVVFGKQITIIEETLVDTISLEEQELLVTNNDVLSAEKNIVKADVKSDSELNTTGSSVAQRGYVVTVNSSSDKFKHVVTTDQDRVAQIFQAYFGTDLDIVKILNYSPYFDMKTDDVYFYAEKGTVKEGKNGKLKFKRLKKKKK